MEKELNEPRPQQFRQTHQSQRRDFIKGQLTAGFAMALGGCSGFSQEQTRQVN